MSTIKIIVCCHKKDYCVSNDVYLPVQVGKKTSSIDLGICSDDEGINISDFNHLYCELTGLYWAWNNLDSDYVGLCHYRRYYCFSNITVSFLGKMIKYWLSNVFSSLSFSGKYYPFYDRVTVNSEAKLFKKSDEFCSSLKKMINKNQNIKIFALNPVLYGNINNETFFSTVAGSFHIGIIEKIVHDKYLYLYPYLKKTLSTNKLHYANMVILERSKFNEYCSFIFGVLEEHLAVLVHDKWCVDIKEKSIQRLSGYLGELLTSAFVLYYAEEQPASVKYLSLLQMK